MPGFFCIFERMKGKEIYIYILELKSGKWYVGSSKNVEKRMLRHQAGNGAIVCKYDNPKKILKKLATGISDTAAGFLLENQVTIDAMIKRGSQNVYGGRYLDEIYRRSTEIWLELEAIQIKHEIQRFEILYRQWSIRYTPGVFDE